MALFKRTLPFVFSRIIIYAIFAVAAMVFLGIMVGLGFLLFKMFGESSGAFIFVMIIAFSTVYGGLRFLERYVLYLVKVAHISVVVELLNNGEIPDGKGQVEYGKEQVKNNFGSANVAFAVDQMILGAIRQIQRWTMRVGEFFSFIPGSKNIIGIINAVMSISLGYIDEAIVSYIFVKKREKSEESVWKSAADGVVLYAQSWKSMIKTSFGLVLFIYAFNIIMFILFALPFMLISKLLAGNTSGLGFALGILVVIGAYVMTTVLKRALIDPIVTIAMIRSYQNSIQGIEPSIDLQSKLLTVSSKFRNLFNKSKEEGNVVT